jgi:hypothetical protein
VLALAGMSRLLRAHLRTLLAVVPRFGDGWEELMLVVESSMAGGRHETAVAAVALLSNVLQVAASAHRTGCRGRYFICLGAFSRSEGLPSSAAVQRTAGDRPCTSVTGLGAVSASKGLAALVRLWSSVLLGCSDQAQGAAFLHWVDQGQSLQGCYP